MICRFLLLKTELRLTVSSENTHSTALILFFLCFDVFDGFLAGYVLNVDGDDICLLAFGDLLGLRFFRLIPGILFNQGLKSFQILVAFRDPCFAKSDHTAEIGGVFFADDCIFIYYSKRYLRALCDGVYFMSGLRRMILDFAVVIDIAEGNRIRVVVIPQARQDAVCAPAHHGRGIFHG